ncbi:hypothetical protein [Streptomyces avidinii]|uniref:Uncharacterized protein n=1 Tax=Streptomyces avidinii TaxID=1895 RepID=A0ABS4L0F3_STRAV|nr:hypothetical protein [Streptomyces avidinii]MBP2035261.1 hypothetical protein [Streptomyces avidinii]GGZ03706.1 hypothetical protein GCM10010343_31970 [Streptomyces avidinii]
MTNREMLEGARGLAENPETGRPEDFAARVLDIVAAQGPTPLRIPVGDDAYGYLDLAEQASREELAAARILTQGPPRRRPDGHRAWCWTPRCPGTRADRGAPERRWSARCRRPGKGLRRTLALGAAISRPTITRTATRMSTVTRFMFLPSVGN